MTKAPVTETLAQKPKVRTGSNLREASTPQDHCAQTLPVQRLTGFKDAAANSAPVAALQRLQQQAAATQRTSGPHFGNIPTSPVLQRVWIADTPGGPARYEQGHSPPPGYKKDGDRKTPIGMPIYVPAQSAETRAVEHAAKTAEEAARRKPQRLRRNFTPEMRADLAATPEFIERQDQDFAAKKRDHGRTGKKAHLTDAGLAAAGKAEVQAPEQMDNDAARKGFSNRISAKAPAGGPDGSQQYGGQRIRIKIRKLLRAQLRGKRDAQNVRIVSTDQIIEELRAALDAREISQDDYRRYVGWARQDREYHLAVDFQTADTPDFVIHNRFIVRPDGTEDHDSDSDSDSMEEDAQHGAAAPPASAAAPAGGGRRRRRRGTKKGKGPAGPPN